MKLFQWSLGARVSGKPCTSDLELETNTPSKMIPLIVSDGESFFCETQPATPPAGMEVDPSYVTKENTPTILVEMWHNLPDEVLDPVMVRIRDHIQCMLGQPTTDSTAASIKPQ